MAEYTPMMMQYLETKEQYKDCILFYRLGDFYEIFSDDAVNTANELKLTLTGRDFGLSERVAMVGFPYHVADSYFNKLNQKYNIAIFEENEITLKNKIIKNEKNPLIEIFGNENYSNDEIMQDTDGTPLYLGYQNGYLYVGHKINNMVVSKYQIKYNDKLDFSENYEKLFYKVYPKENKKEKIEEKPKIDIFSNIREQHPNIIILNKINNQYEAYDEDAKKIGNHLEIELKNNKVILANDKHFDCNTLVLSFYNTVGIIDNDIAEIIPKFDTNQDSYKINISTGEML